MSIILDGLTLPYDCIWEDEFSWSGVQAAQRFTLQGTQIIESSQVHSGAGRPITLYSADAWIERADLLTLHGWAQDAGKTMTLTLHDGRRFYVQFRHWEAPVIEAEHIRKISEPGSNDNYILKIKLVSTPVSSITTTTTTTTTTSSSTTTTTTTAA
jgi:hypothetical protein